MTSRKQIAANRRNARKSTGPRTARGKAIARLNGLKHGPGHGLSARIIVLPHEDQGAFERQRGELFERLGPDGALECELVERLAQLLWRLARAPLAEAAVFADAVENAEMADTWTRAHGAPDDVDALRNALRFSAGLHDSYGLATDRLMRYEAHLERSFRRTLDLFLRLQAMRGGAAMEDAEEPGPQPAMDRFETARQARRQIIAGLRGAGAAEEEVAAYEAREAAYDRQIGSAEDPES